MPDTETDPHYRLSWTVRQLADDLDAGESTIRKWISEGAIPVVRIGGRVLVPGDWVRQQFDAAMTEWSERVESGEVQPVTILSPANQLADV